MGKLIILILLTVVLIYGCQKILEKEESIYTPKSIDFCRDIEKDSSYFLQSEILICYINYGKINGSANCNEEEKNLCDIGIAVKTNNLSYCNNYFCYFGFGINVRNSSMCSLFNSSEDTRYCLLGFAIKNIDTNLCKTLVYEENVTTPKMPNFASANYDDTRMNTFESDYCYFEIARLTKNETVCHWLDSPVKEECVYTIALDKGYLNLCDESGENRIDCRRKVILRNAMREQKVEECYKAGDFDYDMAECAVTIAVKTKDPSVCEQLPKGFGSVQEDCYYKLALSTGDINLCDKADNVGCYQMLTSKDDYEACGNLPQDASMYCYANFLCNISDLGPGCYNELENRYSEVITRALSENNSLICEELGNVKQICYYKFAKKLGFSPSDVFKYELFGDSEQLCERLQGKVKDKCYFNLAMETLDERYCEKTIRHVKRCAENVFLLKRNLTRDQLMSAVQARINNENSKLGIKESGFDNAWEGFNGHVGVLDIYNDGYEKLDGEKFNLYKNFRLIDIDGCRGNSIVFPKRQTSEDEWDIRHCLLEFNTPSQGHILEVTYDDKTVLVDHD